MIKKGNFYKKIGQNPYIMLNRNGTFQANDKELQAVFNKIDLMQAGETLNLSEVAPNKPELWIFCAKKYIDCYHSADFNSDYTKLKKLL